MQINAGHNAKAGVQLGQPSDFHEAIGDRAVAKRHMVRHEHMIEARICDLRHGLLTRRPIEFPKIAGGGETKLQCCAQNRLLANTCGRSVLQAKCFVIETEHDAPSEFHYRLANHHM